MAERLKEFVNGTKTAVDIVNNNEILITSTTTTSQAVITDIKVDKTVSNVTPDGMYIGATKVNGFNDASGKEVVDVSSSLKYVLNPTPAAFTSLKSKAAGILSTSSFYQVETDFGNVPKGSNYPTSLSGVYGTNPTTESGIPVMTATPQFVIKGADYAAYFQYNGNDTTILYVATVTAGVIGSWGAIDSSGYEYKCLDAETGNVYWQEPNDIVRKWDITTNTISTIGTLDITSGNPTSYNHSAFCNGIFFVQPDNNASGNVFWLDTNDTTRKGVFSISPATSSGGLAVSYNADEDIYYIMNWYGISTDVYSASSTFNSRTLVFTGTDFPSTPIASYAGRAGNLNGEFTYIDTTNNLQVVKVSADGITSVYSETSQSYLANSGAWFENFGEGAEPITSYNINIKSRVTGVEITGV